MVLANFELALLRDWHRGHGDEVDRHTGGDDASDDELLQANLDSATNGTYRVAV